LKLPLVEHLRNKITSLNGCSDRVEYLGLVLAGLFSLVKKLIAKYPANKATATITPTTLGSVAPQRSSLELGCNEVE